MPSKSKQETIQFPGVKESLPKYWGDGQLVIYYCNYCQQMPKVADGQIAVSVAHDKCVEESITKALIELGRIVLD